MIKLIAACLLVAGCSANKQFEAKDLGKYVATEIVREPCDRSMHIDRCITSKQIYKNGYVLLRKNGAVAEIKSK